jgi:hypothetical protein
MARASQSQDFLQIEVDGLLVPCTTPDSKEIDRYQFYLKRSGRYYLRNKLGQRISFELDDHRDQEQLKNLKLGEWYDVNLEFNK